MQYRLRTLLLLLGIVPPAIGLVAAIFGDPALRWQLNDPILLIGACAWLFAYARLVLLRPPAPLG